MSIVDRLNSGEFHAAARRDRPDCVDAKGDIHISAERAVFVNWLDKMRGVYGADVAEWPPIPRAEYERRYVPSH